MFYTFSIIIINIINMNRRFQKQISFEITNLDVRIAKNDETSSNFEMLSIYLREFKKLQRHWEKKLINDLMRENEYLRQKIVYYKEARNVMLKFHNQMMTILQVLQRARKIFSKKMTWSKNEILEYWRININEDDDDLIVL